MCHLYEVGHFFFFFTVNHRGPLPLWELHSTDETIVWRDPGGSEPVYDLGCSLLQLVGCLVVGLLQAEAVLPNQSTAPAAVRAGRPSRGSRLGSATPPPPAGGPPQGMFYWQIVRIFLVT